MFKRTDTKTVRVKNIKIGGGSNVSLQSMTNTDTRDKDNTLKQVLELEQAGCDIVRLAVFDADCIDTIGYIKSKTDIPLVADIHFDYKLALKSIEAGIDKLRLNPGNIGTVWKVKEVVKAAEEKQIPIRIGVNSGSIDSELLAKYGPSSTAMVESALSHVRILEELNYDQIVISAKASDCMRTVEVYKMLAERVNYPLHLGVTEAGTVFTGSIYSAVGIGTLLMMGIGDTIRVSLTANPTEEIKTGKIILKAAGLRNSGVRIISCPTCGRTRVNLTDMAKKVEKALAGINKPLNIAVMGCVVNGPGESKEADIGIAGGNGKAVLFVKGKIVGTYNENDAVDELIKLAHSINDI